MLITINQSINQVLELIKTQLVNKKLKLYPRLYYNLYLV
jgi:hypothetical protein